MRSSSDVAVQAVCEQTTNRLNSGKFEFTITHAFQCALSIESIVGLWSIADSQQPDSSPRRFSESKEDSLKISEVVSVSADQLG